VYRHSPLISGALAGLIVLCGSGIVAAQDNRPPVADNKAYSSLYRASDEWTVKTTITLAATDTSPNADGKNQWKFTILHPEQFRTGNTSRLACFQPGAPEPTGTPPLAIEVTTSGLEVRCTYQPPIDREGEETFQYEVANLATKLTSSPATVAVDIKRQGLRWEVVTAVGQSVAGNDLASGLNQIPDVLGKTTGDVVVNLDWVFRHPQKTLGETSLGATADGHVLIRTGYLTRPEAVTATTVTTDTPPTTPPASGATPPAAATTSEDALEPRRKFTFGGEMNYNWVVSSTGTGTFLEFGVLGRGNVDVDVEDDETFRQTADRVLKLVRKNTGAGTFHGEIGGRLVLKQFHRETFQTTVQRRAADPSKPDQGAKQLYTRNPDNFATIEFGLQRDGALGELEATTGITERRYFIRAFLTPLEVPGAPGHSKPLIGIELTGWGSQPKQVKVLYGANLSAIGSLFGLGL
jgi:hypothetical protein